MSKNSKRLGIKKTEVKNAEVVRTDSKKIIIPEGMKLKDAIKWLERQREAEETFVNFRREYDRHPADGAVQLAHVLNDLFGWTKLQPTPGFFGASPPQMRSIAISATESISVPWGEMQVPGIEGTIGVGGRKDPNTGMLKFVFYGEVWQRDLPQMNLIADELGKRMAEESIYKGHAVKVLDDGEIEFLQIANLEEEDLILPKEVESGLAANLFAPIKHTEVVRKAGVPLKRGILLSGDYGTGKSMTATVTANLAKKNGWTFIMVPKADDLVRNLHVARIYQPAVVFVEDIDTVVSEGRNEKVNTLLEEIDGVLSKETRVICVMTTNRLEKMHGSFMRPGRLDAMIHFTKPDQYAAARLIYKYAGAQLDLDVDDVEIGKACEGMIPAAIREVCERSKLHAIARDPDGDIVISTEDLLMASANLKMHTQLVEQQKHDELEEFVKAKATVSKHMKGLFVQEDNKLLGLVRDIHEQVID